LEQNTKQCSPECEFFECGQKKLVGRKGSTNPTEAVCGWVGDPCEGSKCSYTICIKGKLRSSGFCDLLERTVPKQMVTRTRTSSGGEMLGAGILAAARTKVLRKTKSSEFEGEIQ
jgi:hypothetical protein